MDVGDVDIQENKKCSHIAKCLSDIDFTILRNIFSKYNEDFKKMARDGD